MSRCENALAAVELIGFECVEEDYQDVKAAIAAFEDLLESDRNASDCVWFVKYKTPPFGEFWDTARLSIDSPRAMIHHAKDIMLKHFVAKRWLHMYPIRSISSAYRSILAMRSVGVAFEGEKHLSWPDFKVEFEKMARVTLQIQNLFNSLVHGDINEGNMLYDESQPSGQRLTMIDWDEALRPRPCFRRTATNEEGLRYPEGLINFPEQYTKQQLLHLFATLVLKYYSEEMEGTEPFLFDLKEQGLFLNELLPKDPRFLGRTVVDIRFKTMVDGLLDSHKH